MAWLEGCCLFTDGRAHLLLSDTRMRATRCNPVQIKTVRIVAADALNGLDRRAHAPPPDA